MRAASLSNNFGTRVLCFIMLYIYNLAFEGSRRRACSCHAIPIGIYIPIGI